MEQRAQKVETMSISDVRRLKCGNAERFDKGKTIEDIFSDARKQLLNYIHNLKDNSFHTSAFIVMSVGSRRLIWEKIN
jgi:flagellar motor switch protein FliM